MVFKNLIASSQVKVNRVDELMNTNKQNINIYKKMKDYIILFREPDGRMDEHSEEHLRIHQQHWSEWLTRLKVEGRLSGGSSLTLEGRLITGDGTTITPTIHKVRTEIVGGFLLLKANNLDEAAEIASSCPIYESDGYSEVREFKN